MTLTCTLEGHCKVINWPNFNIIVSQGIEGPKERKRDCGTAGQWSSENTHSPCQLSLLFNVGAVCGTPK